MINKTETGKRIATLRNKLGYSQAVFAEKLNVTPQAVSKWETGATLPDLDILLIISWMCRITINEILDADEIFTDKLNHIERELIRMNKYLICPDCRKQLSLKVQTTGAGQYFECENNHRFNIEDGVVFFNSREIKGELWSLWLRNYEHYLQEQNSGYEYVLQNTHFPPELTMNKIAEVPQPEVIWREIEKLRPATIVDIACGTGTGIRYIIERINWRCTIIMTDLSFRILAWNRRFFTEEMRNPYVDLVFLACDCSNIPLLDNSVDMVFSNGGFESMQDKMMAGFKEGHRILKPGGHAVYNMSLINDHDSYNSKKWIELYLSLPDSYSLDEKKMRDCSEWLDECRKAGFEQNNFIKVYDEMTAPDTDVFPFENMILRWMASYVCVSKK
jgi:ubiquinone/menaquinone biosynthesis C-methylase UbiE/transcriptional regulator with XRE-family HTH domain